MTGFGYIEMKYPGHQYAGLQGKAAYLRRMGEASATAPTHMACTTHACEKGYYSSECGECHKVIAQTCMTLA